MSSAQAPSPSPAPSAPGWLPRLGSPGYYLMLAVVAIVVLGPLGGVTAAYMNFSLGFFIGGQVLAGILGSIVTLGYGKEGQHGANYMQTMAASVASMAAMGVLIQAMVWLGMEQPPTWHLILFFLCIGMFGVGVGMLYTPILVDRLQLTYPSGLAVANILRALTDREILKRSVGKLTGGIGLGIVLSKVVEVLASLYSWLQETAAATKAKLPDNVASGFDLFSAFSAATFGGGMIVGARISASAILVGALGVWLTPWLRYWGYEDATGAFHPWLGDHDPFRKIGFIFALGTILGAAAVDMALLAVDAARRIRAAAPANPTTTKTPVGRLLVWVAVWGTALVVVANTLLQVPVPWALFAVGMALVFLMINGISMGITDSNPISSAFVVTVLVMAGLGLRQPLVGVLAGSILLVACTVGVDMQQDRSTGWRLGSDRNIQFRYQMLGVVMGAFLAVVMTRVFLEAYPILKENMFAHPELRDTAEGSKWQSAMTYKFAGILELTKDVTDPALVAANDAKTHHTLLVMVMGIAVGLVIQALRKLLSKSAAYQAWRVASPTNKALDFVVDALLLASPYASSFGGFVDFTTALWFGLGGIFTSVFNWNEERKRKAAQAHAQAAGDSEALPEDMSTTSLVGGGLIAGESLFALFLGLSGLVASGAIARIFGG
ncbi:MAG: peptide transporter [Deltaproteobacteria bacterium]|nr:peptide transporter [Deltaproteobacteria bacterium]